MDFNKINKIERKGRNEVYLPNTRISYICNEKCYPVFLEPIDSKKLVSFRNYLENEIKKTGRKLYLWSYNDKNKVLSMDAIVDFLITSGNPELFLIYHTKTDNHFLNEFLKRAIELVSIIHTYDPVNKSSLKNLDELVDGYLRKYHKISFEDFKKLDLTQVGGSYDRRYDYEAEIDFHDNSIIYLGALSSMNRDLEITTEEFFSQLQNKHISGIKSRGDEMFNFIKRSLSKMR